MGLMTEEVAASPSFDWRRWPETESFVDAMIATALDGNALARELAERMPSETGTRFSAWVDHLVVADEAGLADRLVRLGFERQALTYAVGVPVFGHPGGIFPRIAIAGGSEGASGGVLEVAIKVDSVAAFSR
ncbi:MAG: hypothetical protein ACLQGP_41005, partial [Isosphaeraceae bacterium]